MKINHKLNPDIIPMHTGKLIISVFLLLTGSTGCNAIVCHKKKTDINQSHEEVEVATLTNQELIEAAETFARDEGILGQAAWKKVASLPRRNLITSLLRIQNTLSSNDSLRVDIAFLFCNLDHEYKINKQIVISAFTRESHFKNLQVDAVERLISRLIARGDKELLNILFPAAMWTNAALSEGLADTFADQLLRDTDAFLLRLKLEPLSIRNAVYELLNETVLSKEDIITIRVRLKASRRNPNISKVAKELLKALSARNIE